MIKMVKEIDKSDLNNASTSEPDLASPTSENAMPRIKAELDCLNYANESINNLEIELEESKREFLRTKFDFDNDLKHFENKLGTCVIKAYPYYELRIQLNDLKQEYQNAKNKFETTQELYVAAKKMKEYCEDCLEKFTEDSTTSYSTETTTKTTELNDKETLIKMLNLAMTKVSDSEAAKHSSDLLQIEAQDKYEEKTKKLKESEKNLKNFIEKSRKYYESKAKQNKELKFLYSKCEGLKQCLKEAKETYQKALKNLEKISTEIHEQRNGLAAAEARIQNEKVNTKTSDLTFSFETLSINSNEKSNDSSNHANRASIFQFSQKKHGVSQISDEEIEYLRLDEFLKAYESELKKEIHTQ